MQIYFFSALRFQLPHMKRNGFYNAISRGMSELGNCYLKMNLFMRTFLT